MSGKCYYNIIVNFLILIVVRLENVIIYRKCILRYLGEMVYYMSNLFIKG